jgi:hypothetical protein
MLASGEAGVIGSRTHGEGMGRLLYALEPAARFLEVAGNGADPSALLHKVKTVVQLREMGAEPVGDSCKAPARQAPAGSAGARPLGGPLPKELEDKRKEAEALARFLLENLS